MRRVGVRGLIPQVLPNLREVRYQTIAGLAAMTQWGRVLSMNVCEVSRVHCTGRLPMECWNNAASRHVMHLTVTYPTPKPYSPRLPCRHLCCGADEAKHLTITSDKCQAATRLLPVLRASGWVLACMRCHSFQPSHQLRDWRAATLGGWHVACITMGLTCKHSLRVCHSLGLVGAHA